MSVLKRLTVLHGEAGKEPVPQRKFFHIGQPDLIDDLGEAIPMISWVDGQPLALRPLRRSELDLGANDAAPRIIALPNQAVKPNDGIFLVTGPGENTATPHPDGKGAIHFVHLGVSGKLWDKGLVKLYVYRLEGVQMKNLLEKKH